MFLKLLHDFLFCVPATLFITVLFRVPKKAAVISTILGSLGYILYEFSSPLLHSPIAAYFGATLFMAVVSELLARIFKMPTTVFIIPSIIPLVPGLGLYQTMSYLVENESAKAAQTGINTIFAIVAMAMALVLTSVFTAAISGTVKKRQQRRAH